MREAAPRVRAHIADELRVQRQHVALLIGGHAAADEKVVPEHEVLRGQAFAVLSLMRDAGIENVVKYAMLDDGVEPAQNFL